MVVGSSQLAVVRVGALGCVLAVAACGLDWSIPDEEPVGSGGRGVGGSSSSSGASDPPEPSAGGGGAGDVGSSDGGGAPAASSSSGMTPATCDVGTCSACDECTFESSCGAELQVCADDPPCSYAVDSCCLEIDECIYGDAEPWQCEGDLDDTECIESCYAWIGYRPSSIELHRQLMRCILCDACSTTCAGYQQSSWLDGC